MLATWDEALERAHVFRALSSKRHVSVYLGRVIEIGQLSKAKCRYTETNTDEDTKREKKPGIFHHERRIPEDASVIIAMKNRCQWQLVVYPPWYQSIKEIFVSHV